jgi:hypothetical protein
MLLCTVDCSFVVEGTGVLAICELDASVGEMTACDDVIGNLAQQESSTCQPGNMFSAG